MGVRFEVFVAVTVKNAVFWDVALCRYCVNQRFGWTYRLHLQGRKICERGTNLSRSETSVHTRYTRCHIQEDSMVQNMDVFLCENVFSFSNLLQTENGMLQQICYFLLGRSLHRFSGVSIILENAEMSSATQNDLTISHFLLCCITIWTSQLADCVLSFT
jgi:hypothetical protein